MKKMMLILLIATTTLAQDSKDSKDPVNYIEDKILSLENELEHLRAVRAALEDTTPTPPPIPQPPPIPPVGEYGYTGFTTREPAEGEIVIDSLPLRITEPGYYILSRDLVAPASGINIHRVEKNTEVTIDLNGHTITYATEPVICTEAIYHYHGLTKDLGNYGHYGICCVSMPSMCRDWKCDWNENCFKVVVKNGVIRSGQSEGLAYGDCVNLRGARNGYLENLVLEQYGQNSRCADMSGGHVKNVTCIEHGTEVANRHFLLASLAGRNAFWSKDPATSTKFLHNHIKGSPQIGIRAGTTITHGNLIEHKGTASNCYGIMTMGDGSQISNNRIITENGRGIGCGSDDVKILNNYIDVSETANAEYGRLQTHGIKLERCNGVLVEGNTVIARSSDPGGQATPLSFHCQASEGEVCIVKNNLFRGLKSGSKEPTVAVCVLACNGQEIRDNVFESDEWLIRHMSGVSDVLFTNNVFRGLPGCKGLYTASDSGKVSNLRIQGNTYKDVDITNIKWPPAHVSWDHDQEVIIEDVRYLWNADGGELTIEGREQ